jgi:hypothetical protein
MTVGSRSQAVPVFVAYDKTRVELEPIRLGQGVHNEAWLQALIHDYPAILPMNDIEPGFGKLIPAAREVPCGHGYIDNLYITPSGDIVLVETKLWRNSEMRREVVAQALDYVAAITAMTFDAFEAAVTHGQCLVPRLYDLVRDNPEALNEAEFIDAIAKNLRRGRLVVMVLGDGIRSETELLSDLLQSHAGLHFTFALVEVATWRNPRTGDILAIPSTLAKTEMIQRGIVRIEQGEIVIKPVTQDRQVGPQSITSTDFWESLGQRDPKMPGAIRTLLAALEPLGVYADIKASLNLKADLPNRAKPVNFGYIAKNGQFWTGIAAYSTPEQAWRPYLETLAAMIGGTVAEGNEHNVTTGGRSAPRIDQFLPAHQDGLIEAIATMLRALNAE